MIMFSRVVARLSRASMNQVPAITACPSLSAYANLDGTIACGPYTTIEPLSDRLATLLLHSEQK